MRSLVATLLVSLVISLPAASAAGYLVNVGVGSNSLTFGANVFGGSGDTLDVGLFNAQCSDEADVVDIGIANTEGGAACGDKETCTSAEGDDPIATLTGQRLLEPGGEPQEARCTDQNDAVDVGVLNQEGRESWVCDDRTGECTANHAGDEHDATDVGVLNLEHGDDSDGNDVGVINCESNDRADATDVGILNTEWFDSGDTLDLSILNTETYEGGDVNGVSLGGFVGTTQFDCRGVQVDTPLPELLS